MSCAGQFTQALQARGHRMTPQRQAILHVLNESRAHLTVGDVYSRTRSLLPGITEPTVYRTLEFLVHNGLAFYTTAPDGRMAFQIAAHAHHHLVCERCGKDMEIAHAQVTKMMHMLESTSGYHLTNSHMTFNGVCPDCQ